METKLLPCPFCGGEAKVNRYVFPLGYTTWGVECCSAECRYKPAPKAANTKAEAIEAWNTRHERTCQIEPIKSGARYLVSKYTCCGYELVDSLTDEHASSIPEGYCPNCGAKVME